METYYKNMAIFKPEENKATTEIQKKQKACKNIADFYENGEILMTGATGFLGKLLIDKLLRTFPGINKIYMIVREKRGMNLEERMKHMFNDVVFSKLREEVPDFMSKLVSIPGQIMEPNLALNEKDRQLLVSKVNIVFHLAASVKFNDELKITVNTNLRATRDVLNLAKGCQNLKMFTYVSTAFSNCYREDIDEVIYAPKTHYSELLEVSKLELDDARYQRTKKRVSHENVNTYTLTKAAAEQLIKEEGQYFPTTIFRPSIIISTWKEPIPGWIDNLYGPTGLVTGVQTGAVRSILCGPDVVANMVPADLTVNALICSAWDGYNRFVQDNSELPIYNYVSSKDNPITWTDFSQRSYKGGKKTPPSHMIWAPFFYLTDSITLHKFRSFFLHYLFGYIFDLCCDIVGNKKIRLVPIYKKLDKLLVELYPISTKWLNFENKKMNEIWSHLSYEDQCILPFNIKHLDWDDFLEKYVQGVMIYHLGDKMDKDTRKKALKYYERLLKIHAVTKMILYSIGIFIVSYIMVKLL